MADVKTQILNPDDVPGGEYRHTTTKSVPQSHVNLQFSEAAVLNSATQIYCAYVVAANGAINEQQLIERATDVAIRLAQRVDTRILSAEETPDKGKMPI